MSWFPITWNLTEIMRFAFKINLVLFFSFFLFFWCRKFFISLNFDPDCVGHCIEYAVTFIARRKQKYYRPPFHHFFSHYFLSYVYNNINCWNLNHFLQKACWRVFKTFGTIFSKKLINENWSSLKLSYLLERRTDQSNCCLQDRRGGG